MEKSKLVKVNEKIAEHMVNGYKKSEDAFVDQFLTKEGETVEEKFVKWRDCNILMI